jgi:putative ABC transport system permease protein
MSWFSRLWNHVRSNAVSHEIDREMTFHLDERADDLVAHGMSREDAKREARRRFGNRTYQKERTRERDLFVWLDIAIGDVRHALRSLRSSPAFTLVAVVSLALGIGANTAIFSILNAVMLKSLPVSHPDELVSLTRGEHGDSFTNPLWEAVRNHQDVFSGAFAFGDDNFNLANGGEARRVKGVYVSGDFFSTLGVTTILGRPIVTSDDARGCPGVAVLSYGFWNDTYAADPSVIGHTIPLNAHPFTIIGVAKPGFFGVSVGQRPQVYVPLCSEAIVYGATSSLDDRSTWFLQVVGRPKAGVTLAQVNARLGALSAAIHTEAAPAGGSAKGIKSYLTAKLSAEPAARGFSDLRTTYRKGLYILMGIVALVLFVACANIINLLLARAAVRQREMAVRLALGAGRARLARQMITESLLLSSAGTLLGGLLAVWGGRALVALLSRSSHVISLDLGLDGRVLAFTVAVCVLTGLLFGLAPAWRAGRVDPQLAMKAQGRGIADGRLFATKSLVVGQVALSLVLIACAGLLLASWRNLATIDPGFRRDHVLIVKADIANTETPSDLRSSLFTQSLERLRALPGVLAAGGAQITPVSGSGWNNGVKADGYEPASDKAAMSWQNAVTDGYFDALGVRRIAGRDFDATDTRTSSPVAIVDESMARKYFHTTNAVGKRFQVGFRGWGPPIEVIGVVADTKYRSLRDSAESIIYFPQSQQPAGAQQLAFVIRTSGPAIDAIATVKAAIAGIDPKVTLDIIPLEQQLGESLALPRAIGALSGIFGGLAVVLAAIGLYGLMAYSVARRRNEIGVRIALGAGMPRIVRMVLGDVGRIVTIGVVIGLALSFSARKLVVAFLFGIAADDIRTLAGSAALLGVIALLAAAFPAWRAASLDPVATLKEE